MLCALDNGRPDRLPCQVHSWMDYYLKTCFFGSPENIQAFSDAVKEYVY